MILIRVTEKCNSLFAISYIICDNCLYKIHRKNAEADYFILQVTGKRKKAEGMDRIKEATKNFFVCGILLLVVGIALIALSKTAIGVFSVVCAVVFLITGIAFLIKDLHK